MQEPHTSTFASVWLVHETWQLPSWRSSLSIPASFHLAKRASLLNRLSLYPEYGLTWASYVSFLCMRHTLYKRLAIAGFVWTHERFLTSVYLLGSVRSFLMGSTPSCSKRWSSVQKERVCLIDRRYPSCAAESIQIISENPSSYSSKLEMMLLHACLDSWCHPNRLCHCLSVLWRAKARGGV